MGQKIDVYKLGNTITEESGPCKQHLYLSRAGQALPKVNILSQDQLQTLKLYQSPTVESFRLPVQDVFLHQSILLD